jgi:hypothetical protein
MDLRMLIPIFGILLVMIPVAGLTFGLTLRLAVRPFVETLTKAVRESGHMGGNQQLSAQVLSFQEDLEVLTNEVCELRSGQEFDQKLLDGRDESPATGS